MYTTVTVIVMVICVFLIIVVLVQNSKGGGLAQSFAAQQQIMGVRKTTDFLEKATWSLAAALMVLSFVTVAILPSQTMGGTQQQGVTLDELLQNQANQTPGAAPAFSTPEQSTPAGQSTPAEETNAE